MKTEHRNLYLTILNEYMDGKGIDFARHGINKKDIPDMVAFYQRILIRETADTMILSIIYELLETPPTPTPPKDYKSPAEQYPELDAIAEILEGQIIDKINLDHSAVRTTCPYPAQCLLEMVIARLEKCV